MCDKNGECEQVLKNFKSCLNEMCLPVLNPIVINGSGTITTQFNILDVSVVITITYSSYSKRAEIKINFSLSMEDFDTVIVIQILNAINGEMMDIGHICTDLYCQDIFLQTNLSNFQKVLLILVYFSLVRVGLSLYQPSLNQKIKVYLMVNLSFRYCFIYFCSCFCYYI